MCFIHSKTERSLIMSATPSFKLRSVLLHLSLALAVLSGLGIGSIFQSSVFAVNGCSTPTVITAGGGYAIAAGDTCFKYVNTGSTRGAMWSVMNPGDSTVVNTVQWYGGRNEN